MAEAMQAPEKVSSAVTMVKNAIGAATRREWAASGQRKMAMNEVSVLVKKKAKTIPEARRRTLRY